QHGLGTLAIALVADRRRLGSPGRIAQVMVHLTGQGAFDQRLLEGQRCGIDGFGRRCDSSSAKGPNELRYLPFVFCQCVSAGVILTHRRCGQKLGLLWRPSMYSYADRMRAVQLYIELGKRVGATIRQLGYPTKNALKHWYREYERDHDLAVGYVRSKPWYSDEQKRIAIEHYLSHGRCLAHTRKALGYPNRATLSTWIDEYRPGARRRVVGNVTTAMSCSEQQKQAAVIDLCSRRGSAREVAQAVGVSRQTLYNWKDQRLGREAPTSMTRHRDLPSTASREELQRELDALRRDVQRLQLEHDLLEKANELLKKGLGIDLQNLTNREKTLLVDALREHHALPHLLARLGLARSSYFYHRAQARLGDRYADTRQNISDLFEANHRCYGYRRIHVALARQ